MGEAPPRITNVLLRVVADPGHGGPVSEYRVEGDGAGHTVTLRISEAFRPPYDIPAPPTPSPPRLSYTPGA